jgi:hypothetical protein
MIAPIGEHGCGIAGEAPRPTGVSVLARKAAGVPSATIPTGQRLHVLVAQLLRLGGYNWSGIVRELISVVAAISLASF